MQLKDTGLVIIDVQNDYFRGGLNPLDEVDCALSKTKLLLEIFRQNKLPVVHVQHISQKENAPFFIQGTNGVEIHSEITPISSERVVIKHYANSFHKTNLDETLKEYGIKNLVVCGMMTHHCVDTTVRVARDYDYEVTLIQDACATKSLTINDETISAEMVQKTFVAALQGFAHVIKLEAFIKWSDFYGQSS